MNSLAPGETPRRRRTPIVLAAIALVLAVSGGVASRYYEARFLTTGPNGPETPAALGLPFERVRIKSGSRHLDGYLVRAPQSGRRAVAVLIFHGVQETISQWVPAQQLLYEHGISSLVFDYSGHGDSSRPGSIRNMTEDVVAAYADFVTRFPPDTRRCVLGHSMGNGPLLEQLPEFTPAPSCIVVANAFTSLRDLAVRFHTPRLVTYLMPDVWDNARNITRDRIPTLIAASDSDHVNPIEMGRRLYRLAPGPKQLVELHGFRHNALYRTPSDAWWHPAIAFMRDEPDSSLAPAVPMR